MGIPGAVVFYFCDCVSHYNKLLMKILISFLLRALVLSNANCTYATSAGHSLMSRFGTFYSRPPGEGIIETSHYVKVVSLMEDVVRYFTNHPIDCLMMVRSSSFPFKYFFWRTNAFFIATVNREFKTYSMTTPEDLESIYNSISVCIQRKFLLCYENEDSKEQEFRAIRLMIQMSQEIPIRESLQREKMVATWKYLLKKLEYDFQKKTICQFSFFNLFSKILSLGEGVEPEEELYSLLGTYIALILKGGEFEFILESHFWGKQALIPLILRLHQYPSIIYNFEMGEFPTDLIRGYMNEIKRDFANFLDAMIQDFSEAIKISKRLSNIQSQSPNVKFTKEVEWQIRAILEIEKIRKRLK